MAKKIVTFFLLLFFLFSFGNQVFADLSVSSIDKTTVALEENFQISLKITEALNNTDYFIKCRIGANSSSLGEGQTLNPSSNQWLNDTNSWSSMPQIHTSDTGFWEGTTNCRVKNSVSLGDKIVFGRACPNISGSCSNSFQSLTSTNITVVAIELTQTPSPTETPVNIFPSPTPTDTVSTPIDQLPPPTPTPQTYSAIYISEAMVNPDTSDHEWIELYNNNDFIVYLTNWFIDDIPDGGSSPKKFSLVINPKNYGVVETTSSIFNNDEDSIRLLDFDGKEKDSLQYESTEKGKTLGRISFDQDTFCTQHPSYGITNTQCLNPTSSPTSKPTNSSTPTQISNPLIIASAVPHIGLSNRAVLPTNFFPFIQNQIKITPVVTWFDKTVLGIATENKSTRDLTKHAITLSLSFASFGYSTLAGFSILFKIKKNSST